MPRVPMYRRHPNGQAFVQHVSLPTKDHRMYLGVYGSAESIEKYEQFLARLRTGAPASVAPRGRFDLAIDELMLLYLEFAEKYYSREGKPGKEFTGMKEALLPLGELFGAEKGRDFGPRSLVSVQMGLVARGYARTTVNKQVNRIKRFFRWCCKHEYLPPELHKGLDAVESLQPGQFDVREPTPVRPVKWEVAQLVLPYVAPQIAAMIQVQYFCGMRPQDVCIMRRCDLDTSGEIWLYRPYTHKTAHRGDVLIKAIPQAAQRILKQFFKPDMQAYLFSPRDAWAWQLEHRPPGAKKDGRKTPVYPSELRARAMRKAERRKGPPPLRPKGDHYTTDSYRKAIAYGVQAANREIEERLKTEGKEATENDLLTLWSPNQLRHGIATWMRQTLGQQAAQLWHGHDSLDTTMIYTEKEIAELVGIAKNLDRRLAI